MKQVFPVIILFLSACIFNNNYAQDNQNVLSYYAADNSIDGQPRIDMVNLLRFFPVFAIRNDIIEVNVSVFYGGKIFNNKTDKMNGGQFWQTLLPEFSLGDAIQRIEVEMEFKVEEKYYRALVYNNSEIIDVTEKVKNKQKQTASANLNNIKILSNLDSSFTGAEIKKIFNEFDALKLPKSRFAKQDSIFFIVNILKQIPKYKDKTNQALENLSLSFLNLISNPETESIVKYSSQILNLNTKDYLETENNLEKLNFEKDRIIDNIFNNIVAQFTDSSFSGPAIKKSDLIISEDFRSAKLLYRYYKNNLRYRKALDPAENLGIFRARYIPFPVTRKPGGNKVEMFVPGQPNSNAVFEIGLAFGDNVVSGDNTFNPGLSLSRLGVAIVISEKLFSESAEILGLAFTYDFNTYASIGIGRNLAQGESYPYYSMGINKKAFEQLVGLIAGLFK